MGGQRLVGLLALLGLLALVAVGACADGVSPDDRLELAGVDFGIAGGSLGAHSAGGEPVGSGSLLSGEFAVAVADSLGGLVLVSFDEENAGLFILQIGSVEPGEYACSGVEAAPACHGRFFDDVQVSGGMIEMGAHFEIHSGSATITSNEEGRLQGELSVRIDPVGGTAADPIVVTDGVIDVRYLDEELDDARLWCLIGLTGSGDDCSG